MMQQYPASEAITRTKQYSLEDWVGLICSLLNKVFSAQFDCKCDLINVEFQIGDAVFGRQEKGPLVSGLSQIRGRANAGQHMQ